MNLTSIQPKPRGKVENKHKPTQHQVCRQFIRHQKFLSKCRILC